MAPWPSRDSCRRILREAGVPSNVLAHVEAVARLAVEVAGAIRASGMPVDVGLVEAGALLHDIGRARTHGLDHAAVGARMLREAGVPAAVVLIVERHTGGGIDAEEAARIGLPAKDYTPVTLEEKIVCSCDNLVEGSKRQRIEAELAHLRGKGLDRAAGKVSALHAEVSRLAGRDLDAWTA